LLTDLFIVIAVVNQICVRRGSNYRIDEAIDILKFGFQA
jgi:hypothetical protein